MPWEAAQVVGQTLKHLSIFWHARITGWRRYDTLQWLHWDHQLSQSWEGHVHGTHFTIASCTGLTTEWILHPWFCCLITSRHSWGPLCNKQSFIDQREIGWSAAFQGFLSQHWLIAQQWSHPRSTVPGLQRQWLVPITRTSRSSQSSRSSRSFPKFTKFAELRCRDTKQAINSVGNISRFELGLQWTDRLTRTGSTTSPVGFL